MFLGPNALNRPRSPEQRDGEIPNMSEYVHCDRLEILYAHFAIGSCVVIIKMVNDPETSLAQ